MTENEGEIHLLGDTEGSERVINGAFLEALQQIFDRFQATAEKTEKELHEARRKKR